MKTTQTHPITAVRRAALWLAALLLTACSPSLAECESGCGVAIEDPAPPGATVYLAELDMTLDAVTVNPPGLTLPALPEGQVYLQVDVSLTCTQPVDPKYGCEVQPELFSVIAPGWVRYGYDAALNEAARASGRALGRLDYIPTGESHSGVLIFAVDESAVEGVLAYEEPLINVLGPVRAYFSLGG
ncbi:MAG: hypothetical protein Kow00124_29990 [Anaerolineae bacterium]